jgi:hypothetical protein
VSEDTPLTQALADAPTEPFWVGPRGESRNIFVMVPRPDGADTHGPFTAQAFLDLVKSVRLTEQSEQHTRDCCDCNFDMTVYLDAAQLGTEPLCPVGRRLADEAAEARRNALSPLRAIP